MEIYPSDMIAIVSGFAVLIGFGFLIYFKIEDRIEEKRKKEHLIQAHK